MESEDAKNWTNLNLLLDCACFVFRKVFHANWVKQFGTEWEPTSSWRVILENKKLAAFLQQNNQKYLHKIIEKGDVSSWDLTLLRVVLTAKDLLELPQKQRSKIEKIVKKRNYLAHHTTKIISDEEFSKMWDGIATILVYFGESEDKLKLRKEKYLIGNQGISSKKEVSIVAAAKLEVEGGDNFEKSEYADAIHVFTDGINLPELPPLEQSVLYENRCEVYLEEFAANDANADDLIKAEEDAKRVIELRPDWWKGHFRLGQVYTAMDELKKAVLCLNDALLREPQKIETTNALNKLFKKARTKKTVSTLKAIKCNIRMTADDFKSMMMLVYNQSDSLKEQMKLLKEFVKTSKNPDPELGVAEAELTIGVCYVVGVGVDADICKAINWLQKSINHRCSCAANVLGLIYEQGKVDGNPNTEMAKDYFELGATQWPTPDANAMVNLALIYEEEGDFEKAAEWCQKARRHGGTHPLLEDLEVWLTNRINDFMASDVVNWETTKFKSSVGLTMEQREKRYYSSVEATLSFFMRNIRQSVFRGGTTASGTTKVRFKSCVGSSLHNETTEYEHCVWTITQQSLTAMFRMLKLMEHSGRLFLTASRKIVEYLLVRAQQETCSQCSKLTNRQLVSVFSQVMQLKTSYTEILQSFMISCLARLEPTLAILFINDCIQEQPQNAYFFEIRACLKSAKEKYLEAIRDSSIAIVLNPNDDELLFSFAARMEAAMHSSATFAPQQVLEAYEEFVTRADEGHEKTSEAFYGISQTKLKILRTEMHETLDNLSRREWEKRFREVKKYYNLSRTAGIMNVSFEDLLSKVQSEYDRLYRKKKLDDPKRIDIIQTHRKRIRFLREYFPVSPEEESARNYASRTRPQFNPNLHGFRPITFRDLDTTRGTTEYVGCYIEATVIDEVIYFPSIRDLQVVFEDVNGMAEIFTVWSSHQQPSSLEYPTGFFPGQKVILLNPVVRGLFGVWRAAAFLQDDFVHNMCRYCCKPKANLKCQRCRKARYCDEKCKKRDLTKLNHNFICRKNV